MPTNHSIDLVKTNQNNWVQHITRSNDFNHK